MALAWQEAKSNRELLARHRPSVNDFGPPPVVRHRAVVLRLYVRL